MKMPSTPSTDVTSITDMNESDQWHAGAFEPSPRNAPSDTSFSSSDGSPDKPKKKMPEKEKDSKVEDSIYRDPLCPRWTKFTDVLHVMIRSFVVALSGHAARHPKSYAVCLPIMSLAMLAIGFFTNFTIETEYGIIYAPSGRRTTENMDWIYRPETGFPPTTRPFTLLLHNQGNNVLTKQGVRQVFQVLDALKNVEGYDEVCAQTTYSMEYPNGTKTENACNIIGSTRFWYYNSKLFEEQVKDDQQIIQTISRQTYPDGVPVNRDFMLGKSVVANQTLDESGDIITFAKSFQETVMFPDTEFSIDFETKAIKSLLALRQKWKDDAAREEAGGLQDPTFQLEFFSDLAYTSEFERSIFKDLYLTALVGMIMIAYCCLVFFNRDPVQSRCLLGIGAVVTIALSMAMGHGIMFAAGVPFTNMTMMLPFVVFGVGLDDTFIGTGAFYRKNPNKDVVERIRETMEEVGFSISLTKITTVLAFGLGYNSSVPAIRWLCLYSLVSISFVFLFQITLFQAFVVFDEHRVKANRRDLCFWITVKRDEEPPVEVSEERQGEDESDAAEERSNFMSRYADFLMRPSSKVAVLAIFFGYFGFCIYRATLLTQEFIISEFLPAQSFVSAYFDALRVYSTETVGMGIYFRDIDQSNATVQQQMRDYINDIINLDQVGVPPPFCWVRDMANEDLFSEENIGINISSWSFKDKLNLAMSDPRVKQVYGDDIVRDEYGNITASRCYVFLRHIDFDVVQSQIKMLNDQNAVTIAQPINQGQRNFKMFAFTDLMFLWEFYSVCVNELASSTIIGVVSMVIISFLLIPHWTAAFYVGPIISLLNVDMLGTLQLAGLHINAVTYVCLTISVGLLVDYLMHIMLRYNESKEISREAKVKDTLETMGVSILCGGSSTFLAVLPLAFSTSAIIGDVFTSFFVMVTLGVAHGLVFLPVLLSIIGPTKFPRPHSATLETKDAELRLRLGTEDECNESISSYSTNESPRPFTTVRREHYDELAFVKTLVEV